MDTCFALLGEEECGQIWDRIYAELRFQPSIQQYITPFRLPAPWVVHSLDYFPIEEQEKVFGETVRRALAACMGEDDWIYALDWHHSGFRYDPHFPIKTHSNWVEDAQYMGGGYDAYFPDFYPDGDYYFFVQRDLEWGYLGHPWRRELWLFGGPLIEALSPELEATGFPIKNRSGME